MFYFWLVQIIRQRKIFRVKGYTSRFDRVQYRTQWGNNLEQHLEFINILVFQVICIVFVEALGRFAPIVAPMVPTVAIVAPRVVPSLDTPPKGAVLFPSKN